MSEAEEKEQEALPQDLASLTGRFLEERSKWVQAGKPYRTEARMQEIFSICKGCPMFDGNEEKGACGICGCRLSPTDKFLNKIAWATTHCPHDPPKWEAEPLPEPPKKAGGLFSPAPSTKKAPTFTPATVRPRSEAADRSIEGPQGGCGCGK